MTRPVPEPPTTSVLLNGLRVLESFSPQAPLLGVTEIAGRVGLHKSSVSRILATLESVGYVERDPALQRFRLGVGLLALTGPLLADMDARRIALPLLTELSRATEETSSLAVWNGYEAVIVEQVEGPREVRHSAPIGTRYATIESASVRVFLGARPEAELRSLPLTSSTGYAVLTRRRAALAAELAEEGARGWYLNDGRTSTEEVGLAAPVRDHRGVVVAAVLLSAPRFRMDEVAIARVAPVVVATADDVTARLGGAAHTG